MPSLMSEPARYTGGEQRDARSGVGGVSLAASDFLVAHHRRGFPRRAVVGEEDQQSLIANAQLVELIGDAADDLIAVLDHVAEVLLVRLELVLLRDRLRLTRWRTGQANRRG